MLYLLIVNMIFKPWEKSGEREENGVYTVSWRPRSRWPWQKPFIVALHRSDLQ